MNHRHIHVMAVAAVALSSAPGAPAAAQLDRSRQPVAPPAAPFKFPKATSQTLPNGLRVIVVEEHALPVVTVRAVVNVDSLDDPPGKEGLFALTSALLREGTPTMTADQIAAATNTLGNVVLPSRFTTIPQSVDGSMALMADMLMHPVFPDAAFERRKAGLLAAVKRGLQAPETAPRQLFLRTAFGDSNPLARSALAESSVPLLTRDDVVRFHDAFFRPGNTTIVIVGDVQTAHAVSEVKAAFGGWKAGPVPAAPSMTAVAPKPTTIYLVDQPGAKQTQILVGTAGPPRDSRDLAALDVMSYILGAGSGSRIQQNLRERHSYTYGGTATGIAWRRAPTPSVISGLMAVNSTKADSALVEWLGEIRGIGERAPSEQEVANATSQLRGRLPALIETVDGIGDRVTDMVRNKLPLDYYDGYIASVQRVTPADVRAVAAKYLDPAHLVIVVAGDRKTIESQMRGVGTVVVK